jgi:2-amino-4-hydroxy-6-hydroxymethyldihydropteridine diphosphokinase
MVRSFVAVGSNLGDRLQKINNAKSLLAQNPDLEVIRSSPVYETNPVGGPPQGKYLNAVWEIETMFPPRQLMSYLLEVETKLGRKRAEPNAPRTIDLDILSYGDEIVEEKDLVIPHPRLAERFFVLEPLTDLAPEWVHPKFKKTARVLLEELRENYPQTP